MVAVRVLWFSQVLYENIDLGGIQVSKTVPLYFDISSSDFARLWCRDESKLYADDTVLIFVGTSVEELIDHVNNRLRSIIEWCKCSQLSLNPTEWESMVVANEKLITRSQLFLDSDLIK